MKQLFKSVIFEHMVHIKFVSNSYDVIFKWMPQNLVEGKSTLVQVMAWCHQATSHYLNQFWPRSMSPSWPHDELTNPYLGEMLGELNWASNSWSTVDTCTTSCWRRPLNVHATTSFDAITTGSGLIPVPVTWISYTWNDKYSFNENRICKWNTEFIWFIWLYI